MRSSLALLCLTLATLSSTALAEEAPLADPGAPPEAIDAWRDMRFGMFIHWGPVALTGHEIGWSRGRQTPIAEYDQLYKRFNPTEFDADQWVQTAKAAGMKYLVITTKHHDGFCLWPSDYTDYDIAATPFKRDVVGELAEACRRHGLRFGTYYSTCDWWHPDYPKGSPAGRSDKPNPNLDRYMEYLENQTAELVENYGPLSTMWFDVPREVHKRHGLPATLALRKLQPDIVINNRGYMEPSGDYDTPEQHVGSFNRERPWETCMTICRQWAWKPNDSMKSLEQCVRTLLYTVGGDGNLLFNVGPMPDGRIEPRQVERLEEMGRWVKAHGEAIHGTRGGPIKPGEWGASTCKGDRVYLFVMNWPDEGGLRLPNLGVPITSASLPDGGEVTLSERNGMATVKVAPDERDPIATVVTLRVDGDALAIEPTDLPALASGSVAVGGSASASNVFKGMADQYGPAMAIDDKSSTRWATDAGVSEAWLEVDLGEPRRIGRVMIDEPAQYQRTRAFELQHFADGQWKTFHQGTTIGPKWSADVEPITTQRIRLNILEASDGPTISEFRLMPVASDE